MNTDKTTNISNFSIFTLDNETQDIFNALIHSSESSEDNLLKKSIFDVDSDDYEENNEIHNDNSISCNIEDEVGSLIDEPLDNDWNLNCIHKTFPIINANDILINDQDITMITNTNTNTNFLPVDDVTNAIPVKSMVLTKIHDDDDDTMNQSQRIVLTKDMIIKWEEDFQLNKQLVIDDMIIEINETNE